jgi:hypothetical protein
MTDTPAGELSGRDLDAAVAEAMEIPVTRRQYKSMYIPDLGDPKGRQILFYSSPDCTGLAPVLAWLRENAPTAEQAAAELGFADVTGQAWLGFMERDEAWSAHYLVDTDGGACQAELFDARGDSLPVVACRLLVAWAGKREG